MIYRLYEILAGLVLLTIIGMTLAVLTPFIVLFALSGMMSVLKGAMKQALKTLTNIVDGE